MNVSISVKSTNSDVFIIGGGPVGLTLALELASRGVTVHLAEKKRRREVTTVRCNHISSRSMEIFRRLGLADSIRESGLPGDYLQSVSYRTSTTGQELAHIRIPSRDERFTDRDDGPDGWWPTPEPPHRVNQIYLEPILAKAAEDHESITVLYETEVTGLSQKDDGVWITMRSANGEEHEAGARYLVGCDGGSSFTRKTIGAKLHGDAVIQRVQSTHIRASSLIALMREGPAWAMFSMNPRRAGNVYSIDGREEWLVHNYLRDSEPDFDSVDRDRCIRDILGVDDDFKYDIINNEDWFGRRLVTDSMRDRRVFICGDAAHIWVPYAGYGMNAGIADAANLAWLMAFVVNGWGDPAMLDAYAAERLPITEQVSHFAMSHAIAMAKQRSSIPDNIEEDTPEGALAREKMGREAYELNVQQYACAGLNFGYYYDQSPIIAYDGGQAPSYTMSEFTPSSVPGCRAPHFWFPKGRSLWDMLGQGYTLVCLEHSADATGLQTAAMRCGVPLKVLNAPQEAGTSRTGYDTGMVLVRPDHHVGWRGDEADAVAAERILLTLTGRVHQSA